MRSPGKRKNRSNLNSSPTSTSNAAALRGSQSWRGNYINFGAPHLFGLSCSEQVFSSSSPSPSVFAGQSQWTRSSCGWRADWQTIWELIANDQRRGISIIDMNKRFCCSVEIDFLLCSNLLGCFSTLSTGGSIVF